MGVLSKRQSAFSVHSIPYPRGKNERYKWDLTMRTEIRRSNAVTIGLGALNAANVTRHDIQAFIDVQRQPKVVEVGLNKRGRRGGSPGASVMALSYAATAAASSPSL